MSLAGFEPAIPASERLQTHALDSPATGIGASVNARIKYFQHDGTPHISADMWRSMWISDFLVAGLAVADRTIGRSVRRASSLFTSVFVGTLMGDNWGLSPSHCWCGYMHQWPRRLYHVLLRSRESPHQSWRQTDIWSSEIQLFLKFGIFKVMYNIEVICLAAVHVFVVFTLF